MQSTTNRIEVEARKTELGARAVNGMPLKDLGAWTLLLMLCRTGHLHARKFSSDAKTECRIDS
jgi:hypothetical protein